MEKWGVLRDVENILNLMKAFSTSQHIIIFTKLQSMA